MRCVSKRVAGVFAPRNGGPRLMLRCLPTGKIAGDLNGAGCGVSRMLKKEDGPKEPLQDN